MLSFALKSSVKRNRLTSLAFISVLSLSAYGTAIANTTINKAHLDYQDVFEIEYAASPTVSPDGKLVVYERRSMDVMSDKLRSNLWSVELDKKRHLPLLSDSHSHRMPTFSPSGDRLAYVSSKDGSMQLYVRWMDSGQTVKVTNLNESPSNLAWSPNGKQIAFSMFTPAQANEYFTDMPKKPEAADWAGKAKVIDSTLYRSDGGGFNEAGYTQVYVVNADAGTPRQLTSGDFHHGSQLSWSKDGSAIYFDADRDPNWDLRPMQSDIYQVQLATLEISNVTQMPGPESQAMLSPDGKNLAFMWVNDRKRSYQVNQLMLIDPQGKQEAVSLTPSLDRNISDVQWSKDSKGLYFSYLDDGKTKLSYVSISGKINKLEPELGGQALSRPYTSGSFAVGNKNTLVFTANDPLRPADLWLLDKDKTEQLTELNEDLLAPLQLSSPQALAVKSSVDAREVPAWIVYPPEYDANDTTKSYPLILEIHGGPHAAYGNTFSLEVQLMAVKGYIVVWSNPRGSSSYGEEFANLIHHNYPSQDYNDLMDVVDAAIAKGSVNTDNLFITGGSGGGVLTAWSIGKTDRFAAAVVAKPVINWMSFALTADAYPYFSQYWMEDMPWNISDKLWQRSPLSLVGNVSTPTMLLTGEADYRTPMSETEQYYQALRLRQIDSAMVRIPGASHGIASRPSHLIQKVGNILAWFEKYRSDNKQD